MKFKELHDKQAKERQREEELYGGEKKLQALIDEAERPPEPHGDGLRDYDPKAAGREEFERDKKNLALRLVWAGAVVGAVVAAVWLASDANAQELPSNDGQRRDQSAHEFRMP